MLDLGLVINVGGWYPDVSWTKQANPAQYRSIVYSDQAHLKPFLSTLPKGIGMIALLNGEWLRVNGNWHVWPQAIDLFCREFAGSSLLVEIINESDIFGIDIDTVAWVTNQSARKLLDAGMLPILGSTAGPDWQNVIRQIYRRLSRDTRNALVGAAGHPYGQRPEDFADERWGFGSLKGFVRTLVDITQLPCYPTEFGVKIRDAGGEQIIRRRVLDLGGVDQARHAIHPRDLFAVHTRTGQATYLELAVNDFRSLGTLVRKPCWFAAHDWVAPGHEQGLDAFGLVEAETERKRPIYRKFQSIRGPYMEPEDPGQPEPWVGEGLRYLAEQTGLRVTSGEWTFERDVLGVPTRNGADAVDGNGNEWVLLHNFSTGESKAFRRER